MRTFFFLTFVLSLAFAANRNFTISEKPKLRKIVKLLQCDENDRVRGSNGVPERGCDGVGNLRETDSSDDLAEIFGEDCDCTLDLVDDDYIFSMCWSVNTDEQEVEMEMLLLGPQAEDNWLSVGFSQLRPRNFAFDEGSCVDSQDWSTQWGGCDIYQDGSTTQYCDRDRNDDGILARKACPESCRLCDVDFCDINVYGRTGYLSELNGEYKFNGLDEDGFATYRKYQPPTRFRDGYFISIYFTSNLGWNFGLTLGDSTVFAYVAADNLDNFHQVSNKYFEWFVWDGSRFVEDLTMEADCATDPPYGADIAVSSATRDILQFDLNSLVFDYGALASVDDSQDLWDTERVTSTDLAWMSFSRAFDTGDETDVDIGNADIALQWAMGLGDFVPEFVDVEYRGLIRDIVFGQECPEHIAQTWN